MSPQLRSIARFIVARQMNLPVDGNEHTVRLLRECEMLGRIMVSEPTIAFYKTDGALARTMTVEEFEHEFQEPLAEFRNSHLDPLTCPPVNVIPPDEHGGAPAALQA